MSHQNFLSISNFPLPTKNFLGLWTEVLKEKRPFYKIRKLLS